MKVSVPITLTVTVDACGVSDREIKSAVEVAVEHVATSLRDARLASLPKLDPERPITCYLYFPDGDT